MVGFCSSCVLVLPQLSGLNSRRLDQTEKTPTINSNVATPIRPLTRIRRPRDSFAPRGSDELGAAALPGRAEAGAEAVGVAPPPGGSPLPGARSLCASLIPQNLRPTRA